MTLFLQLMLVWIFLSCAYWFAIRNVLKDAIQHRLFAQRDKLRMLSLSNEIIASSSHYHHLEERLCALIDCIDDISVPRVIRFLSSRASRNPSYQTQQFEEKASPELKQIWNDSGIYMVLGMFVTSPIFLTIFGMFLVTLHFVKVIGTIRLRMQKIYSNLVRKTDSFVDLELVPAFTRSQDSLCPSAI